MQKGKMKEYTLFSRNLGIVLDIQNRKKCKEAIYDCDTALSIKNAQELLVIVYYRKGQSIFGMESI